MVAGDIVFIRGHTVFSELVNMFDQGRFTHVALALSDTHILEIDFLTSARIVPLKYKDHEVVPMGLSTKQQIQLIGNSINVCGTIKYDILQATWYATRWLFPFSNRWDNPNDYICTELVQRQLADIGAFPKYELIGSMTPNELYDFMNVGR